MSRRIYKYPIEADDEDVGLSTVVMPACARIIHVGSQGGVLVVWAIVDSQDVNATNSFAVIGTGWDLPAKCTAENHVGTVQVGAFVWHIFNLAKSHGRSETR